MLVNCAICRACYCLLAILRTSSGGCRFWRSFLHDITEWGLFCRRSDTLWSRLKWCWKWINHTWWLKWTNANACRDTSNRMKGGSFLNDAGEDIPTVAKVRRIVWKCCLQILQMELMRREEMEGKVWWWCLSFYITEFWHSFIHSFESTCCEFLCSLFFVLSLLVCFCVCLFVWLWCWLGHCNFLEKSNRYEVVRYLAQMIWSITWDARHFKVNA